MGEGKPNLTCFFCSNTEVFWRGQHDKGFEHRVEVLCDVLSLPCSPDFLKEFLPLPICTDCHKLIWRIFKLQQNIRSFESKLKLQTDAIINHLKSPYCYEKRAPEDHPSELVQKALKLRETFQNALGIDGGADLGIDQDVGGAIVEGDFVESEKEGHVSGASQNQVIRIPEGISIQDCYVRLERLVKEEDDFDDHSLEGSDADKRDLEENLFDRTQEISDPITQEINNAEAEVEPKEEDISDVEHPIEADFIDSRSPGPNIKPVSKPAKKGPRTFSTRDKEPRPIKCTFVHPDDTTKTCTRRFKDVQDMEAHLKRLHLGIRNGYQCPHCPLGFESKRKLSEHVKIHTGERGDYVCEICGESFRMKPPLLVHRVRKHSVRGEFVCNEESCGKPFPSRKELRDHSYVHLGQFPFPCNQCKAGFGTLYRLRSHLKTKHADNFDCVCEVCGKQFKSLGYLKRHKRFHSDERPFPCNMCSWAFKTKDKLKSHTESTHSRIRPHLCPECGADFKSVAHLTMHLKSHASRKVPFRPRQRRIKTPPRTVVPADASAV